MVLRLEDETRQELWRQLIAAIESYATQVEGARVTPELDPAKLRSLLAPYDFTKPVDPLEALDFVARGLWQYQTHTPHPRYFGLFNPAPTTMGIAADALVAAFNPQLAAWSHSPLAVEIEQHVIGMLGARFGYDPAATDGAFTSGGAEANHTAVLTALADAFPGFASAGVRSLDGQPTLYVSTESHHSFLKAARFCGLGADAVVEIPVDARLAMDVEALAAHLRRDRNAGLKPFMVVATAGTTNAGVVEPLARIAEIAADEGLWLHVDAAWGGAAALVPEFRGLLLGIERADSITFDAHKWLSVPMGAGIYLTRHPDIMDRAFRVAAPYMPREGLTLEVIDPCLHSMQWSRRFIGLKVFMSLMVAGWEGYAGAIRHMVDMGEQLRRGLRSAGWQVVNETPLPLVCFVDATRQDGASAAYLDAVALAVVRSGRAWISTTRLGDSRPVLRACITNYRTGPGDLTALIEALESARRRLPQEASQD
ncbi:MAG TPA: aminotransferase class V-fold PLP-dependent enzyme [Terriglobia bacterium]|nr:aminotransferase class V-fold PLP-dependent enzyme [Terriglobia bacterium]